MDGSCAVKIDGSICRQVWLWAFYPCTWLVIGVSMIIESVEPLHTSVRRKGPLSIEYWVLDVEGFLEPIIVSLTVILRCGLFGPWAESFILMSV